MLHICTAHVFSWKRQVDTEHKSIQQAEVRPELSYKPDGDQDDVQYLPTLVKISYIF